VQFDWGPNQVVTHQALNADFYGPWYEFLSLISALNATGAGAYACGPCVSSVANGTGISATLGTQSSGVGTQITIGLSHGDYADTTSAQTIAGVKTFSAVPVFSAGINNGAKGTGSVTLAAVSCPGNSVCQQLGATITLPVTFPDTNYSCFATTAVAGPLASIGFRASDASHINVATVVNGSTSSIAASTVINFNYSCTD
jgi:hypothetical protein